MRTECIHEKRTCSFFDIKRAYDTTRPYNILKELFDAGFRGQMPKFIRLFMKGRKLRVSIGNSLSMPRLLKNSISQDSTLNRKLFNLAMNKITIGVYEELKKCLYVDDR